MDRPFELAWCYQTLELPTDATPEEIKAAYRKLARQYHPDLNPGDRDAEARFKMIALAYQTLLTALQQLPQKTRRHAADTISVQTAASNPSPSSSTAGRVRFYVKSPDPTNVPRTPLSSEDKWLKIITQNQIYSLLKRKSLQQAINVAEKLASRFPDEPDVYQWLALTYHRWARELIEREQYDQARIYLKKALQADPHNRELWLEIDRDYKAMERQLQL